MELFRLFGNIFINDKEANEKISKVEKKGEGLGKKFGGVAKGVGGAFAKVGKGIAIGVGAGVTAVAGLSVPLIKSAANAEALEAQFEQVFGDIAKSAQTGIEAIAKETGILPNRLKGSFTQMAAFAKTTGMSTADALSLTERATLAAADSAAFYDKSIEDVTESLQSFLKGNFANDAALGISVTETTRNAKANQLYKKSFKELSEEQKQLTLLAMVEDGNKLSGALGQAARESDGLENVLGNLKQAWEDIKVQFGTPILDVAINAMKTLSETLGTVDLTPFIDGFSKAFNLILPMIVDLGEQALPVLMEIFSILVSEVLPPLLEGFSQFAKEILPQLIPIIKQIAEQVIPPLIEGFSVFMDSILPLIMPLIKQFADEILPLLIDAFNIIIQDVLPALMPLFTQVITDILPPLMALFAELAKVVLPLVIEIFQSLKPIIEPIMKAIGDIIHVALSLIKGDWEGVWNGIKSFFTNIWDAIKGIFKGAINNIIRPMNTLIRGLNKLKFNIPDWVPAIGGKSYGINIKEIPLLAKGGNVLDDGAYIAGEKGAELITNTKGATVTPLKNNDLGLNKSVKHEHSGKITIEGANNKEQFKAMAEFVMDKITNELGMEVRMV